jgi:hypothetical protein
VRFKWGVRSSISVGRSVERSGRGWLCVSSLLPPLYIDSTLKPKLEDRYLRNEKQTWVPRIADLTM